MCLYLPKPWLQKSIQPPAEPQTFYKVYQRETNTVNPACITIMSPYRAQRLFLPRDDQRPFPVASDRRSTALEQHEDKHDAFDIEKGLHGFTGRDKAIVQARNWFHGTRSSLVAVMAGKPEHHVATYGDYCVYTEAHITHLFNSYGWQLIWGVASSAQRFTVLDPPFRPTWYL